jgi:hypothetical protein
MLLESLYLERKIIKVISQALAVDKNARDRRAASPFPSIPAVENLANNGNKIVCHGNLDSHLRIKVEVKTCDADDCH